MLEPVNPPALAAPKGYSNGMLAPAGGRVLFVAGQIGWNENKEFVSDLFFDQFGQALRNALEVVKHAGGGPENVGRMTIYVTDKLEYENVQKQVGERYRELMGRHFPAMALVEVKSLLEPRAKVEIEVTAVL